MKQFSLGKIWKGNKLENNTDCLSDGVIQSFISLGTASQLLYAKNHLQKWAIRDEIKGN